MINLYAFTESSKDFFSDIINEIPFVYITTTKKI